MKANTPISLQALASLDLFAGLPTHALHEALTAAHMQCHAKDFWIFNQGDIADRAHALIEGNVRVTQSGADGAHVIVRFIGPEETFGTAALFTDHQYPGDATTLTPSIVVSWSEAELLYLMNRHPQIAINVIKIVGNRLKEAQNRIRELATQPVEQRVANAILRLVRRAGSPTAEGIVIGLPLRRKDIADIAGTTLHTASRILTAWGKAGLLVTHNQRLTVYKPLQIQKIAGDVP